MQDSFAPTSEQEARAQLAAIVESSIDAIIGKTLDGIITSWNAGAEAIYGYTASETIGKPIAMLLPPGHRDEMRIILNCIRRGHRICHYRTQRLTKDGRVITVSLAVSPVFASTGEVTGAATIARDITSIIEAEEALRAAETFTRSILDALSTHLAILDTDGAILYTNQSWKSFAATNGCDASQSAVGANYFDICECACGSGHDVTEAATRGIRSVMDGSARDFSMEYPSSSLDGSYWFEMRVTRFVDERGNSRVVVAHEDITTRKNAEEELRRSEDKFAKAFRATPEMLVISDLDTGEYVDVNENFSRVMGYSREEAIGKTSLNLGLWVDSSQRDELFRVLRRGESVRNWEVDIRKRSGQIVSVLMSADAVIIGERRCLLAVITDVTERKAMEAERETARRRLEEVYKRERRIAETLQRNFLPDTSLQIPGYRTADAYVPALNEAAIGGDVYDLFRLSNGRIGFLVADVSGKGLKAGRYGAMVKYMLRAYAYRSDDPADTLCRLNESVSIDMDIESFVTCFFGILDPATRRFQYANAGHDEPLRIAPDGTVSRLEVTGAALGFQPVSRYTYRTIDLAPHEILFLYTDGVTDARGIEKAMGVDGLTSFLGRNCTLSADSLVNCVLAEVRRRSGDRLRDDVAILALEVLE